jgi:hypothetical protein
MLWPGEDLGLALSKSTATSSRLTKGKNAGAVVECLNLMKQNPYDEPWWKSAKTGNKGNFSPINFVIPAHLWQAEAYPDPVGAEVPYLLAGFEISQHLITQAG